MSNDEWVSRVKSLKRKALNRKSDLTNQRMTPSFSPAIFDGIPNRVHLIEVDITQFLPARFQLVLQPIKPRDKLVSGRLERAFRIDFALPRQVYDREQQIANLIFDHFLLL